ncbi:hypothetical protein B0T19DRAFT_426621 [Cercophora scortea]|uniref:Secreted protein n=1 Tax=Cercophora scortea TaxID=314031 RepID=A0AAE0IEH6_9PEZI|nr:hypothetical protein B0T19DRAFT_426621 [Cercophora scortea]
MAGMNEFLSTRPTLSWVLHLLLLVHKRCQSKQPLSPAVTWPVDLQAVSRVHTVHPPCIWRLGRAEDTGYLSSRADAKDPTVNHVHCGPVLLDPLLFLSDGNLLTRVITTNTTRWRAGLFPGNICYHEIYQTNSQQLSSEAVSRRLGDKKQTPANARMLGLGLE